MKTITAIVETPKGSAQKYDYDKDIWCDTMFNHLLNQIQAVQKLIERKIKSIN